MPDSKRAIVGLQDIFWVLLFGGMALASPDRMPEELLFLALLAVFQLLEPRLPFFQSSRGVVIAVFVKMILGFLLIGFTGGITSLYHPILLLPVISAASAFGMLGTLLFTAISCGAYLLFVHPYFLDPTKYEITREGVGVLSFRIIFLPIVGFLTNQLAEANRRQTSRYQLTAAQLTEANRNLQAAEDAVRRSERLVALGQLSAGLAHELRNPLGTIKASAEMLGKNVAGENEVSREMAGFIVSEVDRANSLVSRFLDFARPLRIRREKTGLNETLDRAVDQLNHHNPPFQVTIHKNYSPDITPFPFDAELLERVAFNLLLNAAQASKPGSTITLKTRPVNGLAEFCVIDRGEGIEEANQVNIFNPFFTTKPDGVGLGLAIVSKIIDEHGGKITVESKPGVGSLFRVLLPMNTPASAS